MGAGDKHDMLLGKHTPVVDTYAPNLLYPISRSGGREWLDPADSVAFLGADLWHAYELSWLDASGKPVVRVGRFIVPASSPNIVESKSFKLYLNSLNSTGFASDEEARQTIVRDISAVAGADVSLQLLDPVDPSLSGAHLAGTCIDGLPLVCCDEQPSADLLRQAEAGIIEEQLHSHLLRSLCPVTGQPDWASLWIHYHGVALDHCALLRYIISYRRHQEFHEQCVERMFVDIFQCCDPVFLHVQAFYTRRGGLDINPFRSTDPDARPLPRLDRQ